MRGVCVAPLLTLLCFQTCLGNEAVDEYDRKKAHIEAMFKKKVLEHLKYVRPPDASKFNLTNIDQTQVNTILENFNKRGGRAHSSKKTYSNADFSWNTVEEKRTYSEESQLMSFLVDSWAVPHQRITSAELIIPRSVVKTNSDTFYLYSLIKTDTNTFKKQLISKQTVNSDCDFLNFDVRDTLSRYQAFTNEVLFIISSNNSLNHIKYIPSLSENTAKLELVKVNHSMRKKRAIDPTDCVKDDGNKKCCRYKIHILFKDIGWDDWVISPAGYDAHYCAGSCPHRYKMAHTFAGIKSLLHLINPKLAPSPHCTATKLSSLTLLHLGEDGYMTYTDYPDMIVDECKCS